MHIHFYLGLSLALLVFPLGLTLGFNSGARDEIREFNKRKYHLLEGVIK